MGLSIINRGLVCSKMFISVDESTHIDTKPMENGIDLHIINELSTKPTSWHKSSEVRTEDNSRYRLDDY